MRKRGSPCSPSSKTWPFHRQGHGIEDRGLASVVQPDDRQGTVIPKVILNFLIPRKFSISRDERVPMFGRSNFACGQASVGHMPPDQILSI